MVTAVKRPSGGHWNAVVGFSASTPLGVEPVTFPNGEVIPTRSYGLNLPGYDTFFDGSKREYWAQIARIAYKRFPALGRGESIQSREISGRLSELRRAGYGVPPFSRMTKEEKWALLAQIKNEVNREARAHGAAYVLAEIARRNERLRIEERELR